MIRDTIGLVDPVPFDRDALVRVLGDKKEKREARGSASAEAAFAEVLSGYRPRAVGEEPHYTGNYERLTPNTPVYAKCQKIKSAVCRTKKSSMMPKMR